ncbi:MAG: hypothetical protein LBG46_06185, partial [Elusimicrobiota bacterium]|nr:hypothetical protein [Elusimicrobiota bacterium]
GYVVKFREVLQNKKILPKDVTVEAFNQNYLYRVDLFTKAIAPTYIAIETGNGLLADDINRDSKFRLIAEIDGTFYSLNSFGKNPGKLYVIKWHLGKIKEVDLDDAFGSPDIDVTIKCEGDKCVSTEHVFDKLAGSDGLSIREFIDCRLADCKINPDQKSCCGVYEISPALGAIGEIIAELAEPK